MNQFQFILQESPWYVLLCLLIAGAFSYYLYEKKTPWTKKLNYFLTGLRFLLFFCVSFLLLSPLVKFFNNILDRPQIVIAIDNSQSITLSENQQELKSLNSTLGALTKELEESGIEVSLQTYQGSQPTEKLEDLRFNSPVSDISGLLSTVKNNFTNKNLSGVVLISDGIFNQGYDPNYNQYTFPIHTIGLGDTVQKKDLNLKYIKNNKIAYTKTRFPIIAEIQHTGFKGKSVEIQLVQNGKVLEKKAVNVLKDDGIESVEFLASSEEKGLQRYTVKVQELAGEFTTTNNIGSAYVEILDSKEKILIIASSPHPDIKALKSALSTKENFEVDIHIPGISPYSDGRYDLVILHQVPDVMGTGSSLVEKIKSSAASLLYMLGSKTDLNQFNNHSSKLKISGRQGQKDLVSPLINGSFGKIKIENGAEAAINNFPPVSVPFGNYGFTGPAQDILLYQKIGSLLTQKPLLILTEASNKKIGVLAGEGIWQWRLREFQATKGTAVFDKLITDCLQYLSNKDDKRKLRVFPLNSEFNDSESAILETETYN
ncbi:MAG TPA: vWA domain-containing protein, partial [Cytophagaceae bacterium]